MYKFLFKDSFVSATAVTITERGDQSMMTETSSLTTTVSTEYLIEEFPENAFGLEINSDGSVNLIVIIEHHLVPLKNHIGDFNYLTSKVKQKMSKKPKNEEKNKNSIITRQYFYELPDPAAMVKDGKPIVYNHEKFLNDYIGLMKFCFEWLDSPYDVKEANTAKKQSDIFKVYFLHLNKQRL